MEDAIRKAGGATNFEAIVTYPNTETIIKHGNEDLILINIGFGSFRSTPYTLALEAKKLNSEEGKAAQFGGEVFKLGVLDGKLDEGLVTISGEIDHIKEIKTCKEIVDELMEDIMSTRY